mmetsp:Transcript_5496/g.7554  ORF Transcript_5496/g.7554 Transcript_5496/m.7554 type:complete len:298 (+) Transcript_5496:109-1002(+)
MRSLTSRRNNGFQEPHSTDQIASSIVHPIVVVLYYISISFVLPFGEFWWAYIFVAILACVVVSCWYKLESEDPASLRKGIGLGRLNRGRRWSKERYCGSCRKTIPGLDHHCTWLNTCVGVRNYPYFFALAISGAVHLGIQVVVGLCAVAVWVERNGQLKKAAIKAFSSLLSYQIVSALHLVLAFICFVALASLLAFHTYLICLNKTTYDWVLSYHLGDTNQQQHQHATTTSGAKQEPGCGGRKPATSNGRPSGKGGRIAPMTDSPKHSPPTLGGTAATNGIVLQENTPSKSCGRAVV